MNAARPPKRVRAALEGWEKYYRVVRTIPRGCVATYGAVAAVAGEPRAARQVGFALAALSEKSTGRIPWQRVLGARGRGFAAITIRDPRGSLRQRTLLEKEGVQFDERGRVSLTKFGWRRARDGMR